jgi:NitT/TauT family transport system substrate-binding protein
VLGTTWFGALLVLAGCGGTAAPGTAASGGSAASAQASSGSAGNPAASASASSAAKPAGSAGGSATKPAAAAKVTIAQSSNSLAFSPVLLADKKGFFQERGLQAEIVLAGSGSKATAALVGGSAQVGSTALGDMVAAVEKGQDIRIFGATLLSPGGAVVLKKSIAQKLNINDSTPIDQRVKALKGLKVSISTPGSATDTNLRYVLSNYGLDPERDVTILNTGSVENSVAAFAQGAADGASLTSPAVEQAILQNDGVSLVNFQDIPALKGQLSIGLWSSGKWLDANKATATNVVAAVWKAMDYMHQSPDDAGTVVRKAAWESLDQKVFDLAWKNELAALPATPGVTPDGLQSQIDFVGASDKRKVNVTPEQLGTNAIVDAAKQQLGK